MSTDAQITANQQNAALSTGPITPEGKAIASRNNFRHGLASGQILIPGEDPAAYESHLADLLAEHNPVTPTETSLVTGLAQHEWIADRALSLQSLCFTGPEVDQKQLALFIRYESTHRRSYDKCLNNLLRLRKERRQEQIGFESQATQKAEETRRQQAHEAKLRLTSARSENLEIESNVRYTVDAPLPGNMRLPFDVLKKVFAMAVRQFNQENEAAEEKMA